MILVPAVLEQVVELEQPNTVITDMGTNALLEKALVRFAGTAKNICAVKPGLYPSD